MNPCGCDTVEHFWTHTHAMDTQETFTHRFGNFYFSDKNHDFCKFQKILETP